MRDIGGEHQRSAFDGQNQRRFLQAEYFLGIYGAKRRELSSFDGGQSDDDHGLRFAERRRIIEAQVQLLLLRQGERRYVLIFRGVEIAENARHVDDRAHIRAVKSAAHERSGAHRTDEIGIGAGSKSGDHRLTVAVVEHELIGILGEARALVAQWAYRNIAGQA